jgi:hypothetical protein
MSVQRKPCPIHRRTDCCGRKTKALSAVRKGWTQIAPGVFRIEDPNHPRGYRHRRSPAAMRELVDRKIIEQQSKCPPTEFGGCGLEFEDRRDVVPDHIDPRGASGAFRDDHPDNIQAMHRWCNRKKGSQRVR